MNLSGTYLMFFKSSRCVSKMFPKTGSKQVLLLLFVAAVASASQVHSIEKRSTKCILPPYPKHGSYAVAGDPAAKPGDEAEYVYLNVSCIPFHGVIGNNVVLCVLGEWSTTMPECVPVCYLQEHPSVIYSCNRPGAKGFGPCGEYLPLGTSVKPECRIGYYNPAAMPRMRCVDGTWDYVAQCTPECGRQSDNATLPWYVHIETEERSALDGEPIIRYRRICGGTIISPNIVISAAHCFWNPVEAKIRTSGYFVVARTGLDTWISNPEKVSVKDVKTTDYFQGIQTNLQHDIALVILSQALPYSMKLHPVCLDFDSKFHKKHLEEGNFGTVGVFPYNSDKGTAEFSRMEIQRIPYIPIWKCLQIAPSSFKAYITDDKICAGRKNSTFICVGNSGSGLAFPEDQRGVVRYFLRGVVSTAPRTEQQCAPSDFIALTDIYKHKDFIIEHLATSLPPRLMGWQEAL